MTTQERLQKLVTYRDAIIEVSNLKGANIPLNSDYPTIIAGIQSITLGLDTDAVEALLDDILGEVVEGDYTVKGQAILDKISDVLTSIANKGVIIPEDSELKDCPDLIDSIMVGGGNIPVHFIDSATGKIIETVMVESGGSAIPPSNPEHDYLTFKYWKGSYTNVTEETWVGAVYSTSDDYTCYLFITIGTSANLTQNIYLTKVSGSEELTIDWGDGVISTTASYGVLNFTHSYAAIGSYCIKVRCTGSYGFGDQNTGVRILDDSYALTSLYLCKNHMFDRTGIGQQSVLKGLVISDGLTTLSSYSITACGLEYLILPDSITTVSSNNALYNNVFLYVAILSSNIVMTTLSTYLLSLCPLLKKVYFLPKGTTLVRTFYGCSALLDYTIPEGITTLLYTFDTCRSLEKVVLPTTVTSIGSSTFNGCYSLKQLIVNATTVPSLTASAMTGTCQQLKIYVPDVSVVAYKAATNWSTYAEQIFPLSQLP